MYLHGSTLPHVISVIVQANSGSRGRVSSRAPSANVVSVSSSVTGGYPSWVAGSAWADAAERAVLAEGAGARGEAM